MSLPSSEPHAWWLDQAESWYLKNSNEFEVRAARLQRLVSVSWLIALGAGVMAVLPGLLCRDLGILCALGESPGTSTLLSTLAILGFALSGFVGNYEEKLGISEQSRAYARLAGLLSRYGPELQAHLDAEDYSEARRVGFALGQEALAETGVWLGTQLSRRLDSPSG